MKAWKFWRWNLWTYRKQLRASKQREYELRKSRDIWRERFEANEVQMDTLMTQRQDKPRADAESH